MVGKDLTWLITLQAQTPNPPSFPRPTPQHTHGYRLAGGRGSCINIGTGNAHHRDHTTHLHGINILE